MAVVAVSARTIFLTALANGVLEIVSPAEKAGRIERLSQTECVQGHCFTRPRWGNQRLQEGAHVSLGIQSVALNGIFVFANQNIAGGELVAQYIGEVLTREAYVERECWKLLFSDRTFGIQVNSSQVIDARYIGGIARFANHAYRPNCVVESWEVAEEICCGLFADFDIARGDEITFNYGSSPSLR
ncbi:Histone-lysine N-methyltransferase setd2 [Phytophthora pseudosyringae]|uniref:Histone-lysine N-methyltransferase setd2 n=1 Tax=Phytophthora pseudosyringae TaxID=221518 RepID=A0A8T1V6W9_9STRA|nr:Histone-lysine N-methyltransferase setd2 [Phytophthora pseudosyringae]